MNWNLKKLANQRLNDQVIDFDYQNEISVLKRRYYFKYVITSGIIGALAVLVYYLPVDLFPEFFKIGTFIITLSKNNFEISPIPILFSVFCLILELYILGLINIRMVKDLSEILNFKYDKNNFSEIHKKELIKISLEDFSSNEKEIGIDPYSELSKTVIIIFFIFNKAKAFLSNLVIKLLVRKLAGRYVLRLYTDLLGMPIYFFWNAYACRKVYRRTIFYFYSQNLTDYLVNYLFQKYGSSQEIKSILYELLTTVAVKKHELSSTHYVYSFKLLSQFGVPFQEKYERKKDFVIHLKNLENDLAKDLLLLFVTGIIIDGSINKAELREIEQLKKELNVDSGVLYQVEEYLKAYKNGEAELFLENRIIGT